MRLRKLLPVTLYSIAMAYVEAVIVIYLRQLYHIEDVVRDMPTVIDRMTLFELGREVATLAMLVGVAWASGRRWWERFAYLGYIWGVWDIWYYVWLAFLIGWPTSPLEWDLLFLLPLPWWGPVLSPALISLLMVIGAVVALHEMDSSCKIEANRLSIFTASIGVMITLYTFMSDALKALPGGQEAILRARPTDFNWPLFLSGYLLMAFPAFRTLRAMQKTKKEAIKGVFSQTA
ncbi:MAG: hypothetical protein U9R11_00715 [Chloroflexota bacterium]|nr:hypothetical protein [Chloroflexota bacterium]